MIENVTHSQLYEDGRELVDNLQGIPSEVKEKIYWMIEGAKLVAKSENKPA